MIFLYYIFNVFTFILRYSKGNPKYTGYEHSWWDIRYIGKTEALNFKNQNFSYEEFVHRNYINYGTYYTDEFHEGYNFDLSNNNIVKLDNNNITSINILNYNNPSYIDKDKKYIKIKVKTLKI